MTSFVSIIIIIIGNPRNTNKQRFRGRSGFEAFILKSFILLLHFLHSPSNSIMAGWNIHYYRAKCADIKISEWFFACPSGTRVPMGPIEPKRGPIEPPPSFPASSFYPSSSSSSSSLLVLLVLLLILLLVLLFLCLIVLLCLYHGVSIALQRESDNQQSTEQNKIEETTKSRIACICRLCWLTSVT